MVSPLPMLNVLSLLAIQYHLWIQPCIQQSIAQYSTVANFLQTLEWNITSHVTGPLWNLWVFQGEIWAAVFDILDKLTNMQSYILLGSEIILKRLNSPSLNQFLKQIYVH